MLLPAPIDPASSDGRTMAVSGVLPPTAPETADFGDMHAAVLAREAMWKELSRRITDRCLIALIIGGAVLAIMAVLG